MPAVPVPSHAIYGTGGEAALAAANAAAAAAADGGIWGQLLQGVSALATVEIERLFACQPHDVIVSVPSQIGGLPSGATTAFDATPSLQNLNWWGIHVTVSKESRVSQRVVQLLNASLLSSLFAPFPAPSSVTPPSGSCPAP
jgi:hypothetical protein